MKHLGATLMAAFFVVSFFGACILDPKQKPPIEEPKEGEYRSLKQKDDVLINLEKAYNNRNHKQYDRLLDENFTFYFSEVDYTENNTPISWDRTSELKATAHIFDRNYTGGEEQPVVRIDLTLDYPLGGWIEVQAPDTVGFPSEKWYEKTVDYFLSVVTASGKEYSSQTYLKALFRIRYANADGDSIWRIIAWHDDIVER